MPKKLFAVFFSVIDDFGPSCRPTGNCSARPPSPSIPGSGDCKLLMTVDIEERREISALLDALLEPLQPSACLVADRLVCELPENPLVGGREHPAGHFDNHDSLDSRYELQRRIHSIHRNERKTTVGRAFPFTISSVVRI